MEQRDIIIVGAGPIGLYLASLLEEKLDVLVLDKNPSFGKKADSGLYSASLEDFIPLQEEWIEHEVSSAILHSPNEELKVSKKSTAAYVVDREAFTEWLASRVKSKILLKTNVTSLFFQEDRVTVQTNQGRFQTKLLIGCDGASSIVRKRFGIEPKEILNGLTAVTREENHDAHVDLYFDKTLIKDGFFWKIPRGPTTEYGALGKNVNYKLLERFFPIKEYKKRAAFMNLGYLKTNFPRCILVGEAAGQVKPWSLGGIIFGFTASKIARDVVFEAFKKGDFSEKFLKRYDDAWKKKMGKTIRLGLFFRLMFEKMDNDTMDKYFRRFRKLPFLNKMDMDFPKLELFS